MLDKLIAKINPVIHSGNRIISAMDNASDDSNNFIFLFRETHGPFRGIYSYYPEQKKAIRIYYTDPMCPEELVDAMIDKCSKYETSSKEFKSQPRRNLSELITTDKVFAVTEKKGFMQKLRSRSLQRK